MRAGPADRGPSAAARAPVDLRQTGRMRTAKVTVHGRVQGVGFRYALQAEAERLGARGWVRNRRDGAVEALVCGDGDVVDAVVAWAHAGPPSARVDRIDVVDADAASGPDPTDGFEIRATA